MGSAEMAGLREVLQQNQHGRGASIRPPTSPVHCERAEKDLKDIIGSQIPRPPEKDLLRATYERLEGIAAAGGKGMDGLSTSELRQAPWVLFEPFGAETDAAPLAVRNGFLAGYLREVYTRGQASAIVALVYCFLLFYPRALPAFDQLREFILSRLLPRDSGPRIARWRTCSDECGLLAADAPLQLAARLANTEHAPNAVLEECCLRGLLATGGLVREAYSQFVAAVSQQLRQGSATPATVERLLSVSRASDEPRGLRFKTQRVTLVDGLLLPFAEGNPGPAVAEPIKAFLLELLGDPRLTRRQRWSGVDTGARQVMLGWLVTDTLEDFFRLLEYAAQGDVTASRHWRARKDFWSRYLRAGSIADAWVALGPLARAEAHDMLSSLETSYASLNTGYNVQQNHSAIIMRIGGLTITEWSHSGKFRAWRSDAQRCPKLYKSAYSRSDLVQDAEFEIAHYSGWQSRIADLIYDQTGVSP